VQYLNNITINKRLGSLIGRSFKMPYVSYCHPLPVMPKTTQQMLYTYVMEFKGGSYVSQVLADSVFESLYVWIEKLENDLDEIKYLGIKTIQEIKEMIQNGEIDEPILLKERMNVWYIGIYSKIGVISINIVKTSYNSPQNRTVS